MSPAYSVSRLSPADVSLLHMLNAVFGQALGDR
jgi:hypothetical protein